MNINYRWKGVEEPLGVSIITAVEMTITAIVDNGEKLTAEGGFTFRDYAEGVDGHDFWVAEGMFTNGQFNWVVKRKSGGFAFTGKDGEPLFTLIDATNTAIKDFVAKKLTMVVPLVREKPDQPFEFEEGPEEYKGPMVKYTGPCCCDELKKSNRAQPFDWKAHTDGGKFAAHCFECSCGTRWVHGEEEMWAHVGDEATWQMFVKYNGRDVEPVGLDPQKREIPTVTLLTSLRARGFIPMY